MYGRGNFPPQHGQGPETSVPTSQSVPPHLPQPPYQHGPHGNGNITQQTQVMNPPLYPAHRQAYPPAYANEHHVPAPTTGMSSSGQSYLVPLSVPPPPPHSQGHSAPMAHPFPGPQQNSLWTPNVQHVPLPLPPAFGRPTLSRNGPEMLLPPPPPRQQPPMISQGQALLGGFVPSPLPGPVHGLQHPPLAQPPPPNHTSYTHGHFGSVGHPISKDPNGSSAGLLPPPLPPSPPPGPPPPPVASPPQASPSTHSKSVGAVQHDVPLEDVQHSDSSARSVQDNSLMDAGLSHSPADSNMDIEDEMTEIDENQRCPEIVDGKSVLVSSECVEKELHEPQMFAKNTSPEEPASRNTVFSGTSEFAEHREGAGVDDKNISTELGTGTSAFKLLQDYASDDDLDNNHDPCVKDIAPAPVYPSGGSVSACLDIEKGSDFMMNERTKNSSESERGFGPSSEHVVSLPASLPLDSSLELQGPSREVDTTVIVKDKKLDDNRNANRLDFNSDISGKDSEQKSNGGIHVKPASDVGKMRKEDGDYNSTAQLKVDEFGRLVREGSGSDSDDLRHRRRHRKRGRIRSRSRSPNNRRRSPQRRRHKRSRSRSWSPRKRSRSRSPSRHGTQYGSDRTRRDKVPSAACFDYKRGKCYRGASCRYSHGDSTKSDLTRGYRSNYETIQPSPKKTGNPVHKHDEDKSQEIQLSWDLSENSLGASIEYNVDHKEVAPVRNISDKDVDLLISSVATSVRTREDAAQVQETEHTRDDQVKFSLHDAADNICEEGVTPKLVGSYVVDHGTDGNARKLPPGNTFRGTESSVAQNSQANLVNEVLQNADHQPLPMDAPSARDLECLPASEANLNPLSVPEPHPDTVSYQSHPATASASKPYSSETFSTQHLRSGEPLPKNSYHASQFLPPPPPTSQDANTPPQMPRDCIMMPQSSIYQSLPTPQDSFTPHQAAFPNQLASFSGPGNSTWNSLPPPPPRRYDNVSTVHMSSSYGLPSHFQENQLPFRNDYPPQQFGGPSAVGKGGLTSLPGYNGQVSSAGEHLSSSSQSYSHLQQPLHASQHLTDVSVAGKPGKTNSEISSYNSDYFQRNLPSQVPDFVGSRVPAYYNPYASSSEQPSSNVQSQAKDMPHSNSYGGPFSSSHVSADARVADPINSKNVTCFPNSNQAVENMLLNSTGAQYDPLFDSLEPPTNSIRTPNNGQKHGIVDDADMNMRHSDSNKPLDFAENTMQREPEAVAVMSSLDNDEYGETAEAEVGAVENGSPSDPIDEANAGEEETDQVKTSGRSKNGKDSRSMKLFKVALADFVKEVLKPSWRQGNMSKEAFKTIVKKTVDKVTGAMKSHQVPKSQTKIDHYIDSSQRKLTKLVMGYVDKYVKV